MKMIDTEKLKLLQLIGLGMAAVTVLGLVFWFSVVGSSKAPTKAEKPSVSKQVEGGELTQEYIKPFLSAYFTKKDLGENRNRYLPFMTEAAYTQEVNTEEEPTNQTYKGYVVDTKLKSATIYIDSENNDVLAQVSYTKRNYKRKMIIPMPRWMCTLKRRSASTISNRKINTWSIVLNLSSLWIP